MSYQQLPPGPWQSPQPQPPNTGYQQPSGPGWPQQPPEMYPQQQPMPPAGYPPQYQQPMYPPGPGMMPPPRPPRKKLSRRAWIIIGVIVLILVVASAVSNANKSTTTPTATAPTATPIIVNSQATATPIPTATHALKWTTVQTFTGNGNKKTAVFTAPDDWKIIWTCNPASFDNIGYNIIVDVDNSDGSALDAGAINTICKAGNTTGNTEEHSGGSVYLDVQSEAFWQIVVQELK